MLEAGTMPRLLPLPRLISRPRPSRLTSACLPLPSACLSACHVFPACLPCFQGCQCVLTVVFRCSVRRVPDYTGDRVKDGSRPNKGCAAFNLYTKEHFGGDKGAALAAVKAQDDAAAAPNIGTPAPAPGPAPATDECVPPPPPCLSARPPRVFRVFTLFSRVPACADCCLPLRAQGGC